MNLENKKQPRPSENEHPFYRFFQLKKEKPHYRTYTRGDITVSVFTEPKHGVKSLAVREDEEMELSPIFFKNEKEMLFILDRISVVRSAYPLDTVLPSLIQTFGRS